MIYTPFNMKQPHESYDPADDTDMSTWKSELVVAEEARELVRALYLNGGKDKLSEDILDSDSPVTGLYQQDKTNKTGISVEQFAELLGDDNHLKIRHDLLDDNGRVQSCFVLYYEGDVLRGAVRIIPVYGEPRQWNGKEWRMAHYMDGQVVPDSNGSMSWIYTKWAWRTVKKHMHECGFDGYNFAGIEGSRIVEYKLRQLQNINFSELTEENEIVYTEREDGTRGITVWHYYR